MARRLQLTLAILKPDLIMNPVRTQKVKQIILDNSFLVVQADRRSLKTKEVEKFYSEHEGKFFYERLVGYMTSGPVKTLVLAREDGIDAWRTLMGPTKTYRAREEAPGSIRAQFGISDTRNATHGSDSENSARKEIEFFFPHFDVQDWHVNHEPVFRERKVQFDGFVHKLFDLENICDHDPVTHPQKSLHSQDNNLLMLLSSVMNLHSNRETYTSNPNWCTEYEHYTTESFFPILHLTMVLEKFHILYALLNN